MYKNHPEVDSWVRLWFVVPETAVLMAAIVFAGMLGPMMLAQPGSKTAHAK